jgi:hypothetical protein
MLGTMMVNQFSDFLGTAAGGDIALGTWPVLVERRYKAKNPSNAARGFTTVPIGAPCSAGHITLPQYCLFSSRDLYYGKDYQPRCR